MQKLKLSNENPEIQPNLVFVYGTLKRNKGNNQCLGEDQEFLGEFKTEPIYTLYDLGGFPITDRGGKHAVVGELFRVNPSRLPRINRLEGYTGRKGDRENWYDVDYLETPYGLACIFVQNHSHRTLKVIENGVWNGGQ